MNVRWTPLVLLVLLGLPLLGQFDPCDWNFRKRIAFDPTKVSGSTDLTDFPVLITFTADPNLENVPGGEVENVNGYDIVFTADDGITQLSHDLDGYSSTTGSLTAWVKIPNLSTSITTYIYMYYGNSAITTDQSSTNTWSNGYVGVWHLDNSLNNTTSVSNLNGTNNGSTNTATSKFNQARNFVRASSQYVDVTPHNAAYDLTSEVTVSCWLRLASLNNDQKIAGNQNGVNGGYKFGVFSDNKIEFEIRTSGNTPFLSRSASGGAALAATTWYYVVGQYSDVNNYIRTYLNGSLDRNYGTTASLGTSNGTLKFGREPFASGAYLDGIIDELRVSNVARSADWIATEYENQNSPSTFYTISAQPKLWDGSASNSWTNSNNWTPTGVPSSGQDVIITNLGNQLILNASPTIAAMWVYPSSTFNNGNSTRVLNLSYDILNCGTITGNLGTIQLNTNTIQVQHLSGTGNYNLQNLTINNQFNVDPTTRLNRSVTVNGTLSLQQGIVGTTTTNILALSNNAVATSGSNQSFVSGPMSKSGNADFVFPIGKGQEWRRLRISGLTASTTFRAEYFSTPFTNTSTVSAPLDNVSQIEFWQLDRTSGTGNANVSLYWENVNYSGIDNCTDLTIARWNGSSWVECPATAMAGSSCSGAGTGTVLTNAVVTNFSPFTFGSKLPGANPLPVHLTSFSGICGQSKITLNWSTVNEVGLKEFVIEKSSDGLEFLPIATVPSKGQKKPSDYEFQHNRGVLAELAYYRLKQVDNDGQFSYSAVIAISCDGSGEIMVYPNPSEGEFLIHGVSAGELIKVFDSAGTLVYSFVSFGSSQTIRVENKGLYILQIVRPDVVKPVKLIVR